MSEPAGNSPESASPGDGDAQPPAAPEVVPREKRLHGHQLFYRAVGAGPVVVLVHGITSTAATWDDVIPSLAEHFTVIAPDLLGQGESAKPRGDYSLGAYASGIRDLLLALGHEQATLVAHSLGGGVALQFAYQFPARCERLVVDSGGLGDEISWLLRAASLPGAELVLPLLVDKRVQGAARALERGLAHAGLSLRTDPGELLRGHASLAEPAARSAFIHTLRAIVVARSQRVDARDRLNLASQLPLLIIWGERPDHPGRPRPPGARARGGQPARAVSRLRRGYRFRAGVVTSTVAAGFIGTRRSRSPAAEGGRGSAGRTSRLTVAGTE